MSLSGPLTVNAETFHFCSSDVEQFASTNLLNGTPNVYHKSGDEAFGSVGLRQ
jgi:hypothetical protein